MYPEPPAGHRFVEMDEVIQRGDKVIMRGCNQWNPASASVGYSPQYWKGKRAFVDLAWCTNRPPVKPVKPVEKEWLNPWD